MPERHVTYTRDSDRTRVVFVFGADEDTFSAPRGFRQADRCEHSGGEFEVPFDGDDYGREPSDETRARWSAEFASFRMKGRAVPNRIDQTSFVSPSAFIGEGVRIGSGCRIGPGAVIGWEGFGYSPDPDGGWKRKPETHSVVIGNNVDIGANTCIDRGSYRDTLIGSGTKVDNLVHIAHNVQVGQDCLIIAGAEVSGSVVIGDGAWIGPNACIKEHLTIGARVMVGIGAVVIRDVPESTTVVGNPARVLSAEAGVRANS